MSVCVRAAIQDARADRARRLRPLPLGPRLGRGPGRRRFLQPPGRRRRQPVGRSGEGRRRRAADDRGRRRRRALASRATATRAPQWRRRRGRAVAARGREPRHPRPREPDDRAALTTDDEEESIGCSPPGPLGCHACGMLLVMTMGHHRATAQWACPEAPGGCMVGGGRTAHRRVSHAFLDRRMVRWRWPVVDLWHVVPPPRLRVFTREQDFRPSLVGKCIRPSKCMQANQKQSQSKHLATVMPYKALQTSFVSGISLGVLACLRPGKRPFSYSGISPFSCDATTEIAGVL